MFVLLTPIVFLFHVCCCDKNVRIKELRKKRFTLSQSSRLQRLTTKEVKDLKTTSHIPPTVKSTEG